MRRVFAAAIAAAGVLPGSTSQLGPDRVRAPERLIVSREPERLVVSIEERGGLGATHLWLLDISRPDVPPTRLTSGAVVDQSPAVSPDGRWLAFSRAPGDTPNRGRIWLRSLMDGAERPVTPDPTDAEPSWSPNGRRIAFTHHGEGPMFSGHSEIKTVNPFDSAQPPPPLLQAGSPAQSNPSWHPRDGGLLFTMMIGIGRSQFAIWRKRGSGSEPEKLIPRGCCGVYKPSYSPDGRRLAYVSYGHSDLGDVYVADADGSNRTRVTCESGWASPLWTLAGDELLMRRTSGPGLWRIAVPASGTACVASPVRATLLRVGSADWVRPR